MDRILQYDKMWYKYLTSLYEYEINVNINIQKQFAFAEEQLRALNDYLDPIFILNLWIPLAGVVSQKLLIQLVAYLGLVNTLVSLAKWCLPEYRPVWWIKENSALKTYFYLREIKIDPFSCDTSAGFPSANATAFTAYALIVVWHVIKTLLPSSSRFIIFDKRLLNYATVLLLSGFIWFARLYFLYEFLHQCLVGSLIAIVMIQMLVRLSVPLLNMGKFKALMLGLALGLMPISVYYAMLYLDEDPFWSVRMAFKWCPDPLHLKHESSPVFVLCRDFGYLMGVALSCPLAKSYRNSTTNYYKRLPVMLLIELLNAAAHSYTPKEYGRFVFVAYEFLRNCMHSFMLLKVLPKFDQE